MRSRPWPALAILLIVACLGKVSTAVDAGETSDGGAEPDAGGRDSGTADAGGPADAGRDAGTTGIDAGTGVDGGVVLTVQVYGSGTGTVTGGGISCPATCSAGETVGGMVTLTATASNGSSFMTWGGACAGIAATCTVTMSGAQRVSATFNPPSALAGVYTHRYDNTRQGQNISEATLKPAKVSMQTFGLLTTYPLDGFTYAQPLYVSGVSINGELHNVVYAATEHDSVYAYDADGNGTGPLWQAIFIGNGATTVPSADTQETGDLIPEFGVTGTPVIDPVAKTLFVVANTKEAGPSWPYRLHALDLATGKERTGSPVVISATSGAKTLVEIEHMQRPALMLDHGLLYVTFGSHGDHADWQGWVLAYDPTTLGQSAVYCTSPTSSPGAAIWQTGSGPAADSSGNVYVETGNGPYDGTNMGDSIIKLSLGALAQSDWFTPSDQATYSGADVDFGSSGPVVFPSAVGSASHLNLVLASGKPGVLYLLDQANMGKYQNGGTDSQIVQSLPLGPGYPNTSGITNGLFGTPAFWNGGSLTTGLIYAAPASGNSGGGTDVMRSFSISGALIGAGSAGNTTRQFGYPGLTPVVTSLGTAGGIVWVLEVGSYTPTSPVVLRAFDASNLANELYGSDQAPNGRDTAGLGVKFTPPLVVNGKVYVPGQDKLALYGLLP